MKFTTRIESTVIYLRLSGSQDMNKSSQRGRESEADDVKSQRVVMFSGEAAGTDGLVVKLTFRAPA